MARDPELISFVKKFVLSVGLGIVLGGAVQKLINAIIDGLIMPVLELLFGVSAWELAGRSKMKRIFVVAMVIAFLALAFTAQSKTIVYDEPDKAYVVGYAEDKWDEDGLVIFLADSMEIEDGAGMLRAYAMFEGVQDVYGGKGFGMVAFTDQTFLHMIPITNEGNEAYAGGMSYEETLGLAVEKLKTAYKQAYDDVHK